MYVYLIQPREFNGCSDIYKIGMSSKEDLSRLRSYGLGTRYICMMEVKNYLETERRLKSAFGSAFVLDHGNEYYKVDNEDKAIDIFMKITTEMRNSKCKQDKFSSNIQRFALKSAPVVLAGCVGLASKGTKAKSFVDQISRFKFASK